MTVHRPPPPPFYPPPTEEPATGLSIASLVCGIVGIVAGLIPLLFIGTLSLALVAIVLGFIAWARRGRVRASVVIPVCGIVLGTLAMMLGFWGLVIVMDGLEELDRDLQEFEEEFDTP